MKTLRALLAGLLMLAPASGNTQARPTTGYVRVHGLRMYYEVHGRGEPLVLIHGAFMNISNNWADWIPELARTRRVIAVELQGHGRTADGPRDMTSENLADDVASLLDSLHVVRADLIGYSMGGAVALQTAIRHPAKVRKAVIISSMLNKDGAVKEAAEALTHLSPELFKGSPLETDYKALSPTPNGFEQFVRHLVASSAKERAIDVAQLKATTAPMFFVHGDADGVRLEHVAEMFRAKGGGVHGDMRPRSASRLAIIPNATHVTLMQRAREIIPMVNTFLNDTTKH